MGTAPKGKPAPGPKGHPIFGSLLDFKQDVLGSLMAGFREYGDVVRFKVKFTAYLIAHPDHVKHVLQDNHRYYPHPPFMSKGFSQVTGQGLVASQGDYWLRQRRLCQPAFHRQRIMAFGTMMTDTIAETLEKWEPYAKRGEPINMRMEMLRLALNILAKAIFGADWGKEADAVVPAAGIQLEHVYKRLETFVDVPEWAPLPSMRRFVEARQTINNVVYRLIRERRQLGPDDSNDLISMLIQVKDEETGETMTDEQVRDEIMSAIIAGHETVSTGLTWMWYLLSKNPAAARRIRQEVAEVVGDRRPTVDDIPKMKYLGWVVDEGLRLYPPLWVNARTPVEDDVIGGYHIEKGAFILLSEYVIHRHPDFWENPEGFDPERFSPERSEGRHRWAYVPFGGGPRKCIGFGFALVEINLIIAMVLQHYRPDLVPGFPVAMQPGITLRAKNGMLMTLEKPEPLPARAPASAEPATVAATTTPTGAA